MNWKTILSGLLLLSIVLAGCVDPQQTAGAEAKDCGNDIDCFSELVATCAPGKVSLQELTMDMQIELNGLDGDNCQATYTVNEVHLDSPDLIIYPNHIKENVLEFEDKSMACLFALNSDVNFVPEQMMDSCEGELKDTMINVGAVLSEYQANLYLINEDCIPGVLWDLNYSSYESFGLVDINGDLYCKTKYAFLIPNRFSWVTVNHYAGFMDEYVKVEFPKNLEPPEEFFGEWCISAQKWTEASIGGTAKVLDVESLLYEENVPTCHFEVLIQPVSTMLPSSTVHAYSLQDGRSAIEVKTNNYNTYQFTFDRSGE